MNKEVTEESISIMNDILETLEADRGWLNIGIYEACQKAQKLIEFQYHISIYPLVAAPGGKEPGYTTSRWNIL